MSISENLASIGLALPTPPAPAALYERASIVGNQIYVSGQIPIVDGAVAFTGKVGKEHDLAAGQKVAQVCALNVLAVLDDLAKAQGKTLEDIRVARISVFVNAAPGFTDIHLVANGASETIKAALGDHGLHARSAVGMAELPLDVPVEVEAIAEFL